MSRTSHARSIVVVTGSRAEFGLLRPIVRAIDAHEHLRCTVIVTGSHHLNPRTAEEVMAEFPDAVSIEMQQEGSSGRFADAEAVGRGVIALAGELDRHRPDVVLVPGDRIEAFAAASAASISGMAVAHVHGGDRAEGIADEAMRHAITKLAHVHFAATPTSAQRIIRMGEQPGNVHTVGSPALDNLSSMRALDDETYQTLGAPDIIFLLHPIGDDPKHERSRARAILTACLQCGPTLALHPNHDAGREGIVAAIEEVPAEVSDSTHVPEHRTRSSSQSDTALTCPKLCVRSHLERSTFIGLLRRARVIIGNSSAGLIEAAALGAWAINVGARQDGRERPGNVIDLPDEGSSAITRVITHCMTGERFAGPHPYGDGTAGSRIATILAEHPLPPIRKRNVY